MLLDFIPRVCTNNSKSNVIISFSFSFYIILYTRHATHTNYVYIYIYDSCNIFHDYFLADFIFWHRRRHKDAENTRWKYCTFGFALTLGRDGGGWRPRIMFLLSYIRVVVDENFLIDRWSLISRIKIYCRFFITISLEICNLRNSLTILHSVYYTTIKWKLFLTCAWTIFYFW